MDFESMAPAVFVDTLRELWLALDPAGSGRETFLLAFVDHEESALIAELLAKSWQADPEAADFAVSFIREASRVYAGRMSEDTSAICARLLGLEYEQWRAAQHQSDDATFYTHRLPADVMEHVLRHVPYPELEKIGGAKALEHGMAAYQNSKELQERKQRAQSDFENLDPGAFVDTLRELWMALDPAGEGRIALLGIFVGHEESAQIVRMLAESWRADPGSAEYAISFAREATQLYGSHLPQDTLALCAKLLDAVYEYERAARRLDDQEVEYYTDRLPAETLERVLHFVPHHELGRMAGAKALEHGVAAYQNSKEAEGKKLTYQEAQTSMEDAIHREWRQENESEWSLCRRLAFELGSTVALLVKGGIRKDFYRSTYLWPTSNAAQGMLFADQSAPPRGRKARNVQAYHKGELDGVVAAVQTLDDFLSIELLALEAELRRDHVAGVERCKTFETEGLAHIRVLFEQASSCALATKERNRLKDCINGEDGIKKKFELFVRQYRQMQASYARHWRQALG